ncbi:16S rRNA (guanine(966)-N(2))-methyltransferase RsmD [Vicingaceae bacterium]|nr:16S rRNA (guanine(966)-N(2))-methyltransferase RsmD [Vicingaceae bacterium]
MRIISGIYKGKRLSAPKNLPVRPTTDFAKEGLFNILNSRIDFEGISVLDLCAGTGNISLEFASREASLVTSVDQDRGCINFIRKTAEELNFNQIRVIRGDIFSVVKKSLGEYDVIFADPPFGIKGSKELPDEIIKSTLLKQDGIFIMEHPKDINYEQHENLVLTRKFGNVHFSLFQH